MTWKRFNILWIVGVLVVAVIVWLTDDGETYDISWLENTQSHEIQGYELLNSHGESLKQDRELTRDLTLEEYDRLAYEYVDGVDRFFTEYSPYLNTQLANPYTLVYPDELSVFSARLHDEAVYFFTVTNGSVPKEREQQHEALMNSARGSSEAVRMIFEGAMFGDGEAVMTGAKMYVDTADERIVALSY